MGGPVVDAAAPAAATSLAERQPICRARRQIYELDIDFWQ
jgi:hypothetical protein